MSRIDNNESEFNDSIKLGRRSLSLIPQIKNWCANIKIESDYGGMMGQMGIPTMNSLSCTQFGGGAGMNLEWVAHDFIIENCPNCKFHKEIIPSNFGRKTLQKYKQRKQEEEEEKKKELNIIQQLESRLTNTLTNDNENIRTTESSILRLLLSLKDSSGNKKKIAKEIDEASKLSPSFFNSDSIDYLSIYFKDEAIKGFLIDSAYNVILKNEKIVSDYFIDKVSSLIRSESRVDNLVKVLPFKTLKKEQIINTSSHLIEKYDLSSFDRYDYFENHSPAIISFFEDFYSSYSEEFYSVFKNALKKSDSSFRANAVLILNKLFSIKSNILIPLIKDLIISLDLQDKGYHKSADYIISKTLIKVTKSKPKALFDVINEEFKNLTIGGKVEIVRFYELFVTDSIKNSESLFTKEIINQLIGICLGKDSPKLREKAIDTFKSFSQETPKVLLQDFDNFIGVLSQSVIKKSTFEWYKEDLDKNTLTFNPLKGKHIQEIMLEETLLNNEIDKQKDILKNLLKYDQVKLYGELIEIIRNIDKGDKNSTQLKLFFIEIIQDGVKDSIILSNILPDLHTWLLDFKNRPLRVQALKFLKKLLSNNFQIIPQTLFSLLEIFIEDNDNLIKKYATLCYKQILINGKALTEKEINVLLGLYKNKYVIVHKTATELSYRLFDVLDNKNRNTLLSYLINLLEIYHNETDRDVEFCKDLLKQSMYVSREVNSNHFTKTEKVLVEKYLAKYCRNNDYYTCLKSLEELTLFKEKNSQYNSIWLEEALYFIKNTQTHRFTPFINSDRGKLYVNILSLSQDDLLPFKDSIKENIKKRSLANIELFSSDLFFTLIIFSFFNLNRDVLELTTFIKEKISRTQVMNYFFNRIDEFTRLANLALINEINFSPREVKNLIENKEVSENEVIAIQEALSKKQFTLFKDFKIKNIESILSEMNILIKEYKKLVELSSSTKEGDFFHNIKSLYNAILLLLEWSNEIIQGNANSNSKLLASKVNINLINTDNFNHIPRLKKQIQKIVDSIKAITDFDYQKVENLINNYAQIEFPFIYHLRKNEKIDYTRSINQETEENNEVHIVSLELYLRENPWANPQILKSKEVYIIKGIVKLNQIPSGFNSLKIQPSTTNSDIFELNIDEVVLKNDKLHYEINGSILFKYAQNSLEELISIKLIPFFSNQKDKLYPTIIGYDELITKVLDVNNDFFLTGFKMMNKKSFELYNNSLVQQLDNDEKNNFFTILNGIINYQGYCLQSGKYKGIQNCKEDDFRDELIQYLAANPKIGENISKEAHIAGGRVEINYKGVITELKVENRLSERVKLIKKYSNQPLAYSSGNSKLASIVCILDLTEKNTPPSPAINNIIINSTKTHGFHESNSEFEPFQVFVFIDGNTKNPSDYSK